MLVRTKPNQVDEEAKTQSQEQPEGATPNPDAAPKNSKKEEEMTESELKAE